MSAIPHYLHIYQKPAVGSDFIKRFPTIQYRHKISANGGFDTATCLLSVDRNEGENIFANYIGNRVAIFANNPLMPIWEGMISRVTLTTGALQISRSLEKMYNRVAVQYSIGQGGLPEQTAEVTNADSIALYGSKGTTVDMGETYTTDAGMPTERADRRLDDVAFPVVTTVFGRGGQFGVALEMIGFYHTLTWDTFAVTGADSTDVPELLFSASYTHNDNIFYDLTDDSRIDSTSYSASPNRQLGESTWDLLMRIAESGSGGDRFVAGISETNPNTGTRIGYFEEANLTVEYAMDAYGDGRIRTTAGGLVQPWDVRPNRVIKAANILLGAPEEEQIGNIAYIKSVDYDAETGQVTLQTDDNLTLEGVFNLTTITKGTNERFGAPKRQSATDDYVIDNLRARENLQVGEASAPIQAVVAGRNYATVQGSTSLGIFEAGTEAADADTTVVGGYYGVDGHSSTEKRIAAVTMAQDGGTAGERGGRLRFQTKANNGALAEHARIEEQGDFVMGDKVAVTSGSADGFTYYKATPTVHLSRSGGATLSQRRRGSNGEVQRFFRDTTQVGDITVTTTNTAYNTTSDRRLKENIHPAVWEGAIEKLKALPVRTFNFIGHPEPVTGFIADELQAVAPEAVSGEKDDTEPIGILMDQNLNVLQTDIEHPDVLPDTLQWVETGQRPVYQGVDYSKLVPTIILALQAEIGRRDAELSELRTRLERLEQT